MESTPKYEALELVRGLLRSAAVARRQLARALEDVRLAPEEWLALEAIAAQEGATQGELVATTLRDRTTLTRLVDVLVDRGFVARVEDAADRRRQRHRLTKEGRELVDRLRPKVDKELSALFGGHPAEELDAVRSLFSEIRLRGR